MSPNHTNDDTKHDTNVHEYLSSQVPIESNIACEPQFTVADVILHCSTFRLNTTLGSDNISPHFLRHGGPKLHAALLFLLFSICSRHGITPSSFCHAHVMALYKGEGDIIDPSNYRPISITSIIARIYERLLMPQLLQQMRNAHIPATSQFGFTKHCSTHDGYLSLDISDH